MIKGKRSGSQNLALALPPGDVVPCRHGNTGSINTRHLGAYPVEAQAYIFGRLNRVCRPWERACTDSGPLRGVMLARVGAPRRSHGRHAPPPRHRRRRR